MIKLLISATLALPLLVGCASRENVQDVPVADVSPIPTKPSSELVRSFVENDAFIDVDVKAVIYGQINAASRAENNLSEEDFAKMQAAIYRFYKHVSIVDSQYVWDLNSGAEINISEDIYNAFVGSLQEGNAQIREWNAKGERVELGKITEEYLESLLK